MELSSIDKILILIAIILGVIIIGLSYEFLREADIIINFRRILTYFVLISASSILAFLFYKLVKEKTLQITFLGTELITSNYTKFKEKIKGTNMGKILLVITLLGLITFGLNEIKTQLSFSVVSPVSNILETTISETTTIAETTTIEYRYNNFPRVFVPTIDLLSFNFTLTNITLLSKNPDLLFNKSSLIELNATNPKIKSLLFRINSSEWKSNGFYYKGSLPKNSPDNTGIIIIHPRNIEIPRFLSQNISNLPNGSILFLRVADIEKYLADINIVRNPCPYCADAVLRVLIINMENNLEGAIIYESVIDAREGWKDIALNLSKFSGKNITLRIEGHAGGPCGEWCGEWLAVDKVWVGKVYPYMDEKGS